MAREYLVALPPELSPDQRVVLARAFSREIADRYNVAVDLAIHAPRPEGDPRNFHAHLLATTREVTPEGLGPQTGLDMTGEARSERGLPPSRQEFRTLRARWAELTNEALQDANIEARIDHRSLKAQGIDREPINLPRAAIAAERRGERSEVAERLRERQRQRMDARRADVPRAGTARDRPEPQPETRPSENGCSAAAGGARLVEVSRQPGAGAWRARTQELATPFHGRDSPACCRSVAEPAGKGGGKSAVLGGPAKERRHPRSGRARASARHPGTRRRFLRLKRRLRRCPSRRASHTCRAGADRSAKEEGCYAHG